MFKIFLFATLQLNLYIKLNKNKFDQVPKFVGFFLAVDQNFKITKNDIYKSFDQLTKKN